MLSAAAVLCTASSGLGPPVCFPKCKLRICDFPFSGFLKLRQTDVPFTDAICRDGLVIGNVGSSGEAFVDRDATPGVLKLTEAGVGFSPSFFKTYTIPGTGTSGIGHEAFQGGIDGAQAQFFETGGGCIAVPMSNYQVLGENGYVVENVPGGDPMTDCVGIRYFGVTDS